MTLYRGSEKHKNRPTEGRKGTLCPEWTHRTSSGGYGHDPFKHDWSQTAANTLFTNAVQVPGAERRFATANGIAFEAKPTKDGTWHGYPVPWESVPTKIVDDWIDSGKVTKRQVKSYWTASDDDLKWALGVPET